jgi:hypothetical protein
MRKASDASTLWICGLSKGLPDGIVVGRHQALIPADKRLHGNRLRRGEGQIVQRPPFALLTPIHTHAVRTVARPEKLACLRVQRLADRFKLRPRHFAAKPEQLRSLPLPFALHAAMLIVVIAVFEMPLGIPHTARHGPYRQHNPTLTLFEFRMQELVTESQDVEIVVKPKPSSRFARIAVKAA